MERGASPPLTSKALYGPPLEARFDMSKKGKHVVPRKEGGWAVKTAGKARAGKVFENKTDAVKYARDSARKERGELYVHGRDGTIKERRSYGKDPFPPRDKK